MKDLFGILRNLEKDEHIHIGRLLILLYVFHKGSKQGEIEGLTKLAKLDFLLRYPVYLERALLANNSTMKKSAPKEYERMSVEAKMVRFKYGPWDFRYRRFINMLIGKNLVYMRKQGRTYYLGITDNGTRIAEQFQGNRDFEDVFERAGTIRTHFNMSGTWLMRFIYKTFPEISTLQFGNEIL